MMNRICSRVQVGVILGACLLAGIDDSGGPVWAESRSVPHSTAVAAEAQQAAQLVLRYVRALVTQQVDEWAQHDLACLARTEEASQNPEARHRACWEAMLTAHRNLLANEPEPGIFEAVGRETGFGLIHESHRHADFWKDYPPALAVSPVIVYQENPSTPLPRIELDRVEPSRPLGLVLEPGQDPVPVTATVVYVTITYPDPLTAPMALRPGEPWWASPVARRYGPVRKLRARFVVVSGLRSRGFQIDRAVVNDAIPGAPRLVGPTVPGIVPDSPQWWERDDDPVRFETAFQEARRLPSLEERVRRYRRLLTIDPHEPRVNAVYGTELYQAFLQEGLKKGRIVVSDDSLAVPVAELYWNLQAQTWRQEFTEVAMGHSFAADAFYGAITAFERALEGRAGDDEMRRRLGALYRWNNDANSALALHEPLLEQAPAQDRARRSQLLADIAWDRVQWLSWNRRYDHPWMTQARVEAEQALDLATAPIGKVVAGEALLVLEALTIPRDHAKLQDVVDRMKAWHNQLTGVTGLWTHLIGNDVVKSLIPEGMHVKLPSPQRSAEVMDTDVHWKVPSQDIFKTWHFDDDRAGAPPKGFEMLGVDGQALPWQVVADAHAPSHPHVVAHTGPCSTPGCLRLLLADTRILELPDVIVHVRFLGSNEQGEAGIALAARDAANFYAVTLDARLTTVRIYRVKDGILRLLGEAPIEPKPGPWHVLRAQVVNSAHVDHPLLEIYLDGRETKVEMAEPIHGGGRIGLVTKDGPTVQFDRLGLIEMVTNRPLSKPAAY
ncbi:MAG: hypothetical protein D6690_05820 [Nitrospirae bacterium]|nr:MAG: hypothetical protein D6690_05820 [Nitrospirota bacterium]